MIVKSEVQAKAHEHGVKVSAEFHQQLEKVVSDLLTYAINRAKGNGRKTLQAQDI
jgi:histone H3/H4